MPENINLPPHNIEAEKWVISWALLDSEVMWIYDSDKLGYQDFYQKEHSYIYEAIQQLRMARKTIDVVTVSDQLSKNWNLDVIGGVDYLYDLSSFLFSTQPCSEYSKIVREKGLSVNQRWSLWTERHTSDFWCYWKENFWSHSKSSRGEHYCNLRHLGKESDGVYWICR